MTPQTPKTQHGEQLVRLADLAKIMGVGAYRLSRAAAAGAITAARLSTFRHGASESHMHWYCTLNEAARVLRTVYTGAAYHRQFKRALRASQLLYRDHRNVRLYAVTPAALAAHAAAQAQASHAQPDSSPAQPAGAQASEEQGQGYGSGEPGQESRASAPGAFSTRPSELTQIVLDDPLP